MDIENLWTPLQQWSLEKINRYSCPESVEQTAFAIKRTILSEKLKTTNKILPLTSKIKITPPVGGKTRAIVTILILLENLRPICGGPKEIVPIFGSPA